MQKDEESLKETQSLEEIQVLSERQPFNDVIDHFNKIEGNTPRASNAKLNSLPKPIKYLGYFIIFFFLIAFLLTIVMNIID
ncbi:MULTISPECIES: amino acid transporter [Bacillaceae]|uniref:amino acid transporter n=1 Tax=Bacillaceae TaxID=186817 RepID=UPI000BF7A08E|nr:amino acid transporter [Bacillus sp. AFS088145]PFH90734.1 amino acid transporter [Bacillus sp. AFS088145]